MSEFSIPEGLQDAVAEVQRERDALKAEVAAMRPWADFGRRVLNERWYLEDGVYGCCYGSRKKGHDPDCIVGELLALKEAEDGNVQH